MNYIYNNSEIFKSAWNLVRKHNMSLSKALKAAWGAAKAAMNAAKGVATTGWGTVVKSKPAKTSGSVEVEIYKVVSETAKAILVQIEGIRSEIWLPLSQIKRNGAIVSMPSWLANAKGIK